MIVALSSVKAGEMTMKAVSELRSCAMEMVKMNSVLADPAHSCAGVVVQVERLETSTVTMVAES